MNYKFYAKALFEAFSEKEEKEFESFFRNFIQELKRKNRLQILPKILKEVGKYFDLAKKGNLTEVVVRDKRNFDSWKDEINKLSKEFDLEEINIVENEKIIGGFILKNSKKLLDNSYKTKLLRLFEKISK